MMKTTSIRLTEEAIQALENIYRREVDKSEYNLSKADVLSKKFVELDEKECSLENTKKKQ